MRNFIAPYNCVTLIGPLCCRFSNEEALERLTGVLQRADREELMGLVKIGWHQDTEVTFSSRFVPTAVSDLGGRVIVTQTYCSALSCAYSGVDNSHWEAFARLVLNANYEATLWAAVIKNMQDGSCEEVFLTLLGGGVLLLVYF